MAYPILAANSTWFTQGNTTVTRASITQINIVDSYTPTGNENTSWNADVNNSGSIKCYVKGTVLTIAGNGSGKIAMNADSSFAFAAATGTDRFSNVTSIVGANLLDTSNVTTMNRMFQLASSLRSVDVSTWNTSKVTTLQGMFDRASSLTALACENWDTSNVTNMGAVFQGAIGIISLDLSKWKTDKVTNMSSMFMSQESLGEMALTTVGDISGWNVSKVTTMANMFKYCTNLISLNLSNWNVSQVTTFKGMFYDCHNLTLNISNWNVSNLCTDISYMFNKCYSITELNLSNWNTSNVTTMATMFQACNSLRTLDLTNWNFSKCTNMNYMFNNCTNLITIICNNWNTQSNITMKNMFRSCEKLTTVDLSTLDTSSCTDMYGAFAFCSSLIEINASNWDISKVTTLEGTFVTCTNLQTLDVSKWNTSNVTTMYSTFENCNSLIGLNPSNWNTSSCTNMRAMFNKCTSLTELNLSKWNTSKVTSMRSMFSQNNYGNPRSNLKIKGIENWDTSSCTDMSWMFYGCNGTGTLDFSGWDVSKVTTMCHFLAHSGAVVSGYENWDTSSMINMNGLFHSCLNTSYDVSKWNTSKVETFAQLFEYNAYLTEIKGLENWDTSSAKSYGEMFNSCTNLKKLNLSSFNTKNVTSSWVDSENGDAGGLTDMLANLPRLEKVILGENFSFIDADSKTSCVLPTPSVDYIPEADGKWYTYDGVGYAPANVPSCVAQTYYAVNYEKDLLVKYKTMYNIAEAIRTIAFSNKRYTPAGIIEGLDEVYKQGQLDLIASTEVLQGAEAEGNPVVCNNVSPVKHEVAVKLSSKNLFKDANTRIYINPSKTYYITSDESTATRFAFCLYDKDGNSLSSADDISIYNFYWANGTRWFLASNSTKLNTKLEFKGTGASRIAYLEWQDMKYVNVQFEEGDTPTAYAPYVADFSDCKVKASGKNLVDMHNPRVKPTWDAFESIDNNTIRFYGRAGYANAQLAYRVYAPVGTKVTISYEDELGGEATGRWYIVEPYGWAFQSGSAPTVPEQGYLDFTFARSGGSGNNKLGWVDIKNLQVEKGTTATDYEPYIGAEYTAAADGTVSGVMSIYPDMTLIAEPDALINCNYYKDIDKTFAELTTAIAMSGGN